MKEIEKLTKLVEDGHSYYYSERFKGGLVYRAIAEHLLQNGVRIQKHGHWIEFGERSEYEGCVEYHCSECNFAVLGNDEIRWNFCPCCGAKMDEVTECQD